MFRGKPPPLYEILIAIPYWSGDRALCKEMTDLIVDLEPFHVKRRAAVLLVHRQDCFLDKAIVAKLKTKFDVFTLRSFSPMRGWPDGCNGMFGSAMIHVRTNKIPCKCIYWMEADCTPTAPGWFDRLSAAWQLRKPTTLIMGWVGDANGDGTGVHITGCALYDPEIAIKMPKITTAAGMAWDFMHRRDIMAKGERTPLIENLYRQKKVDKAVLENGYAVIHGVKDGSLLREVRRKYLTVPAKSS